MLTLSTPGESLLRAQDRLFPGEAAMYQLLSFEIVDGAVESSLHHREENNVYFMYIKGKIAPIWEERKCLLKGNPMSPTHPFRAGNTFYQVGRFGLIHFIT